MPTNGIWLCTKHARLIDNNKGVDYAPSTLISYKNLHESRVALEHEGIYSSTGWIHSIRMLENPIFKSSQVLKLAKLNLIIGNNSSGKSALLDWIQGAFYAEHFSRWLYPPTSTEFEITYLDPTERSIVCKLSAGTVSYELDGKMVPSNYLPMRIYSLNKIDREIKDVLEMIANCIGVERREILFLIDIVNRYKHTYVTEIICGDCGSGSISCKVDSSAHHLDFNQLSGGEQASVILEFLFAAARLSGSYAPTLLILDDSPNTFINNLCARYYKHLIEPATKLQVFLTIPTMSKFNINDQEWDGWQVVRTAESIPNIIVNQELRGSTK